MDHADPAADRVRRPGQVDLGAVDEDLALVRAREPVEDVHQGRLARTVLAEQGVDPATDQVDRTCVGDDARIAFGDAPHLEGGGANLLGLRRHRCLGCVHHDGYDERFDLGRGRPARATGSGSVADRRSRRLPHSGAGGQVLMDPSFMPASAVSSLVWMSAGSLLAAS